MIVFERQTNNVYPKHKRRKQSKTAYVRLECIDGSKVAVKPGMNDKQTQKQADCNGAAAQPFI